MAAIIIPTSAGEVELFPADLPSDAADVIGILREERVPIRVWTQIAVRSPCNAHRRAVQTLEREFRGVATAQVEYVKQNKLASAEKVLMDATVDGT